jgi:hypothetical protein
MPLGIPSRPRLLYRCFTAELARRDLQRLQPHHPSLQHCHQCLIFAFDDLFLTKRTPLHHHQLADCRSQTGGNRSWETLRECRQGWELVGTRLVLLVAGVALLARCHELGKAASRQSVRT